jgi:hypothetical protein
MQEEWRDVVGFEGRYEVSNWGRVRSLAYRSTLGPQILQPSCNYAGYQVLTLGKARRQFRLHVLVLEAFVGLRPEGMQACHRDNDKSNNRLSNLRWDTPSGNIADRRSYWGSENPRSKLTDEQRVEIRRRRRAGERTIDLAREFGVTSTRVGQLSRVDFTKEKL